MAKMQHLRKVFAVFRRLNIFSDIVYHYQQNMSRIRIWNLLQLMYLKVGNFIYSIHSKRE